MGPRWTRSPMRSARCPSRSASTSTRRSSPPRTAWSSACPPRTTSTPRRSTRRSPAPGWSTCPTSSLDPRLPVAVHAARRAARRARPGTRRPPSPTPRSSATTSTRSRRTCAARPARTWTRGTTGSGRRTSTPSPTSASPRTCPTGSSSPRWTATSRRDPALAAVLSAIKATVKGGVGKLRERPQGALPAGRAVAGPAAPDLAPRHPRRRHLQRPGSTCTASCSSSLTMTGLYPLAVLSDCVVYPSPGASPLDFLPYAGRASRSPAASASASPPAWSSTRASRRCCGRST